MTAIIIFSSSFNKRNDSGLRNLLSKLEHLRKIKVQHKLGRLKVPEAKKLL
jgi:hypothetical protein